ncbi:unnamed protein product [Coregonus sp. 'balchen']|nr:unnamed protein product [Coregonus sp. 'balchen']
MEFFSGLVVLALMVSVGAEGGVGPSNNSSFCSESKECLEYELVCKTDEYEVRHYSPTRWVSTDAEAYFMGVGAAMAFRRLFQYITGANNRGEGGREREGGREGGREGERERGGGEGERERGGGGERERERERREREREGEGEMERQRGRGRERERESEREREGEISCVSEFSHLSTMYVYKRIVYSTSQKFGHTYSFKGFSLFLLFSTL